MTREEAIKVLNMVEAHGLADKAKHMAIKALEQEPCDDAINKQVALESFFDDDTEYTGSEICSMIRILPSVKPQEKTGHWIDDEFGSKCSCCGIHTHLDKFDRPMKFKYCSMCGAKMIELQESENKECM